jgi:hypothetical protein
MIWLEAESGTRTSPMTTGADGAASGGTYIMVTAGNNSQTAAPTAGWSSFTFNAPVAGTYKLWARMLTPTTSDDSYWVRMDTGAWVTWDMPEFTTWTWSAFATNYTLTAGSHTFRFAYREDGAKVDKILLTTNSSYTPTGLGN